MHCASAAHLQPAVAAFVLNDENIVGLLIGRETRIDSLTHDLPVAADLRLQHLRRIFDLERQLSDEEVLGDLEPRDEGSVLLARDQDARPLVVEELRIMDADVADLLLRDVGFEIDAGARAGALRVAEDGVHHFELTR